MIAGTPDLPAPPAAIAWAEVGHDDCCCHDDGNRLPCRAGLDDDHLALGLGYDLLVAKHVCQRTDELTATIGGSVGSAEHRLILTLGARRDGAYGGEQLQNQWHRTIGCPTVHYDVEDPPATAGLVLLEARATTSWAATSLTPVLTATQLSCGESQADGELLVGRRWGTVDAWAGPAFAYDHGRHLSVTSAYVQERERGLAAEVGLRWSCLLIGLHWGRSQYGTLGLAW